MAKTICTSCGSRERPIMHTRGSVKVEIILWCCFLLPGLIYSLWKQGGKGWICRECGNNELVPIQTPRGKELVARFDRK
ncbi:hypothetical protein ACFL6N_05835 [Thermodesulfobacteriota bacterium]